MRDVDSGDLGDPDDGNEENDAVEEVLDPRRTAEGEVVDEREDEGEDEESD